MRSTAAAFTQNAFNPDISIIADFAFVGTSLNDRDAEALAVPWDRVHDEAEVLEHVLSEELEELIAAKLGDPTHDPHGDPIPTRDGRIAEVRSTALSDLEPGATGTFVRVSDSDPEMLRDLAERGIAPGATTFSRCVPRPSVPERRSPACSRPPTSLKPTSCAFGASRGPMVRRAVPAIRCAGSR